jgi:hypothetical protein
MDSQEIRRIVLKVPKTTVIDPKRNPRVALIHITACGRNMG